MKRKTMMGLAAVAGVVALLYMRSRGGSAESASTGSVLTSNSAWLNDAMGNSQAATTIYLNTKPLAVSDATAVAPAPTPAPAPTTGVDWSFGGTSTAAAPATSPGHLGDDGYFYHSDGSRSYVADRAGAAWLPF